MVTNVLFVHGLGRTPLSALPMLWQLRRHGYQTHTFGYIAAFSSFSAIVARLEQRIRAIADEGSYVIVAHSLGGVLSRQALANLPPCCPLPRELILLGSPVQSSLLAKTFRHNLLFRWISGDCGQLLATAERMQSIPAPSCPSSAIIGDHPLGRYIPIFHGQANDTIVTQFEAQAPWLSSTITTATAHTWLPAAPSIGRMILDKLSLLSHLQKSKP